MPCGLHGGTVRSPLIERHGEPAGVSIPGAM